MRIEYSPDVDGEPDPGEVVWTWVSYEDKPQFGKDRPVLLIGRDGDRLFGLMLTSKDHDRDARQEAAAGRFWMDVGSGPWDSLGRPSEVRLNRLLEFAAGDIRREGAIFDKRLFGQVIKASAKYIEVGSR